MGETWTRFRFSSTSGIGPVGGVSDGEVEDYAITISDPDLVVQHYPSSSGYVTLAFEDSWPVQADYDMNDVVVAQRITSYTNQSSELVRYDIQGQLLASGAGYSNGYGIQLDGIRNG